MIHRVVVRSQNPKEAACPWWFKVNWLATKSKIEFGDGLNVIFGGNGTGKSTLLTTIAKLLCCFDGDQQLVGQFTLSDITDWDGDTRTRTLKRGVDVEHDGSPIMHFDPSQIAGLIGGGFDWDFGEAGIQNTMFKGSHGETTMMRMTRALSTALDPEIPWPEVKWKVSEAHATQIAKFLKGDGNRVRPTLLLDEPSKSLDLTKEIRLFQVLQKIADSGVQVIVATHSVFALHLKGAKFLDTSPGYSERARFETECHFLERLLDEPELLDLKTKYVQSVAAREKVQDG